ncbi:hypothetical protein BDZ89DRAFT_1152469 [Hymenopellis radicata]|nr:hypothetical protein BDZ89DRAFT_1152469 [Hymenopellis radicata]
MWLLAQTIGGVGVPLRTRPDDFQLGRDSIQSKRLLLGLTLFVVVYARPSRHVHPLNAPTSPGSVICRDSEGNFVDYNNLQDITLEVAELV